MRIFTLAAALSLSLIPSIAGAQEFSWSSFVPRFTPGPFISAQPIYTLPPSPGIPVDFVACPELTSNGYWVATDPVGYVYSLAGAPVPANRVVRVTGVTSGDTTSNIPGWSLASVRVIAGPQPCRSAGAFQNPDIVLGLTPPSNWIPALLR